MGIYAGFCASARQCASAHRLADGDHVGTADGVSSAKPHDLAERQSRRQRGRVRPYHGAVRGLYHRRPHLDEHGDGQPWGNA